MALCAWIWSSSGIGTSCINRRQCGSYRSIEGTNYPLHISMKLLFPPPPPSILLLDSCLQQGICISKSSKCRIQQPAINLPIMSWTDGVATAVYLGGRHGAHDGVYGVVHEAVGHAVLLDDVLANWSGRKKLKLQNSVLSGCFSTNLLMEVSRSPVILGIVPPPTLPVAAWSSCC